MDSTLISIKVGRKNKRDKKRRNVITAERSRTNWKYDDSWAKIASITNPCWDGVYFALSKLSQEANKKREMWENQKTEN